MNRAQISSKYRLFKWPLFGVELFLLWTFCNTLFLFPAPFWGERGVIIAVAAFLASGAAFVSGRMFFTVTDRDSSLMRNLMSSPPVVICVFVLSVATVMFVLVLIRDTR